MDDVNGLTIYDDGGNAYEIFLMDDNDEYLSLVENPEPGVYGFENSEMSITAFVEEP